jgi:Uma2 family endonuclease
MASAALEPVAQVDQSPFLAPGPDGRARFSRETYYRMFEVGVFGKEPHVELIDGEIMMMWPIGPLHGALVRRLTWFFVKNLPETIECSAQLPIIAGDHSEPLPDIALIRRRDDSYKSAHPSSADVVMLIEVSESSLKFDTGRKLEFYASIGIAEYWVVDVATQSIIVHRQPTGTTYRDVNVFTIGSAISPASVPNCSLDLAWLFR